MTVAAVARKAGSTLRRLAKRGGKLRQSDSPTVPTV
jgi:hypothetical protein